VSEEVGPDDPKALVLPHLLDFSFRVLEKCSPHIVAEGQARIDRLEVPEGITVYPEGPGVVFKWAGFPLMLCDSSGRGFTQATYAEGSYEPRPWRWER